MSKGSQEKLLYCSFCGKSQHEVKKLIAGPSVFICDECIALCNDIIRDEVLDLILEVGVFEVLENCLLAEIGAGK